MASKSPWRKIALGVGALVALVAVAAVVVVLVVDPEDFKPRIEAALEDATGWDATLGAIDVSILRGLALTIAPATLAAPGGDSSQVEIGTIAVHARVLPLLRGSLEIERVDLVEPAITLVKHDAQGEYVLPALAAATETPPAEAAPAANGEGLEVALETLRVVDGNLRLVDRSVTPAAEIALTGVAIEAKPMTGALSGSADVLGGALSFARRPGAPVTLTLDRVPTEALSAFLGEEILRRGGSVSLEATIDAATGATGRIDARGIGLATGPRPLESVAGTFRVERAGAEGWALSALDLAAGAVKLTGSGSLAPALALRFEIPPADLAGAESLLGAIVELPITMEAPGSMTMRLQVDAPAGGAVSFAGDGSFEVATLRVGDPLPDAKDVRARFALRGVDSLTIDIDEARIAEGPSKGRITVAPLVPPGQLVFDGRVDDASFGGLLRGFAGEKVGAIGGPTDLAGRFTLDLSRETIDPSALAGTLTFDATEIEIPGLDLKAKIANTAPQGTERLVDALAGGVQLEGTTWPLRGLTLRSGDVEAQGDGRFDWAKGSIELDLTARLDPEKTKELVAKRSELRLLVGKDGRLALPLAIEGDVAKPKVTIDLKRALKEGDTKKELLRGLFDKLTR